MMDTTVRTAIDRAAQAMHNAATVDETLTSIVNAAREALPVFDHVGVSLTGKDGVRSPAQTSDLVSELDALQYQLREGPCWDTLQGEDIIVAPTIRHDQRWPNYIPSAVKQGLRSQLALRLFLDDEGTVGGLNMYSTSSDDIPHDHVVLSHLFATHAATALGSARKVDNLTAAIQTRQTIGKALGILMERYTLDEREAQAFLWRVSSHSNVKVRDLAATLVEEVTNQAGQRRR